MTKNIKEKSQRSVDEVYAAMEREKKYLDDTEGEFLRELRRKILIAVLLMFVAVVAMILSIVL